MAFTNIKTKLAVLATFLGLGGLGVFAMTSNPAYTTQAGGQAPLVSTQVPGAGNGSKVAAAPASVSTQPISTRTSGGATVPVSSSTQPVTTQLGGGGPGAQRGGLSAWRGEDD